MKPPTLVRSIWILARCGARRWLNRVRGQLLVSFWRKRGKKRTATPRKSRRGLIFGPVIGLMMLFAYTSMAAQLVTNICEAFSEKEAPDGGRVEVSLVSYLRLSVAEDTWQEALKKDQTVSLDEIEYSAALEEVEYSGAREVGPDPEERKPYENLREYLVSVLEEEARHEHGHSEEQANQLVEKWLGVFKQHGKAGFAREGLRPSAPWSGRWPSSDHVPAATRAIGLVAALCTVAVFLLTLAATAHNSNRPEWYVEWLYGFPLQAKTIFLAKVFAGAALNVISYLVFIPFLAVSFWYVVIFFRSVDLHVI